MTRVAYLEQLMDQDTRLVHHGKVQRTPVLEKGQIDELVVDGDVDQEAGVG